MFNQIKIKYAQINLRFNIIRQNLLMHSQDSS